MKNYLIILSLGLMVFGCRPKYSQVPGNIIQPDRFTAILLDIRLAEANQKLLLQQGIHETQLLDSSYHIVYKVHNVSQDVVLESYHYYVLHPEWMDKITNDVIDRLNHLSN